MKRLGCVCLILCLLGCQSKPKEEAKPPVEEVIKMECSYQVEPYTMDQGFDDLLMQYPESQISFYQASNHQLIFGFKDPACTDQVGRTKALYAYDLETKNIRRLLEDRTNIYVNDVVIFNDYYLYMIKDKAEETFLIVSEDAQGVQKVLYEETNVGFMQRLKFEIGEDSLYFTVKKELNDSTTVQYQEINKQLEVKVLWEKKANTTLLTSVLHRDNAVFNIGKDYFYFIKGELNTFTYSDTTTNITLLKDYILLNEKDYFNLKTKEIENTSNKLPVSAKSSYVYGDAVILIDEGKMHVDNVYNKTVETKSIYDFGNPIFSAEFVEIEANKVLLISRNSKESSGATFYLLTITEV